MKKQKQQVIQKKAKKSKKEIIEALEEYLIPMFVHQGNVDISYFKDEQTAIWLATLCDVLINIHDTKNGLYFCADDVLTKTIIVEDNYLLKFWGVIYWLETPDFYKINKNYLSENSVLVIGMKQT